MDTRIDIRSGCLSSSCSILCTGFECLAVSPRTCSQCGCQDFKHELVGQLNLQTRKFTPVNVTTPVPAASSKRSAFSAFYTPSAGKEEPAPTSSNIPSFTDFTSKKSFESLFLNTVAKPSAKTEANSMFKGKAQKTGNKAPSVELPCAAWVRRHTQERLNPALEEAFLRRRGLVLERVTFERPQALQRTLEDTAIGADFVRSGKFVVFTLCGQNKWRRIFSSTDPVAEHWSAPVLSSVARKARSVIVISPFEESEEVDMREMDMWGGDAVTEVTSVPAIATVKEEVLTAQHNNNHHSSSLNHGIAFSDSEDLSDNVSDSSEAQRVQRKAVLEQQLKDLNTVDLTQKKRKSVLQQAATTADIVVVDEEDLPATTQALAVRPCVLHSALRDVEQQHQRQREMDREQQLQREAVRQQQQQQQQEADDLERALLESVQTPQSSAAIVANSSTSSSNHINNTASGINMVQAPVHASGGGALFSAAQIEALVARLLSPQLVGMLAPFQAASGTIRETADEKDNTGCVGNKRAREQGSSDEEEEGDEDDERNEDSSAAEEEESEVGVEMAGQGGSSSIDDVLPPRGVSTEEIVSATEEVPDITPEEVPDMDITPEEVPDMDVAPEEVLAQDLLPQPSAQSKKSKKAKQSAPKQSAPKQSAPKKARK